jgi:hypothetical protein
MNRNKPGKPESRGAPIEDPQTVQDFLHALFEAEAEFSIKVEGTSTLPYASRVQLLQVDQGRFVLKLVRPLPHELPAGAEFRMIFAAGDQRFEGLISLIGREAYLQYGFRLPSSLLQADRRADKRYPFRPRESAYVIAQDSGIPGLGVAGPLVNISLGGLALRLDRALNMEDGVRIRVNSAQFERGKGFPRLRVQDLPRLRLLEGRAVSAHVTEHGSELILGLSFIGLDPGEQQALAGSLEFRDKMYRGGQPPRAGSAAARTGRVQEGEGEAEDGLAELEDGVTELEALPEITVLLRLQRRTARIVLAMAEGPVRRTIQDLLRTHGYHRLATVDDLTQAKLLCEPGQRRALPCMILADLALARSGDAEPLAAVRIIENQLTELGGLPTAILCEEVDPTLLLVQGGATGFLPYPSGSGERWVAALDAMLT